jgi:hypothetical protein
MADPRNTNVMDEQAKQAAERIYHEWDEALGAKDVDAALKSEEGIIAGRDKLREFLNVVFERTPPVRQRYREGFFTDGHKLIWEYPRQRPDGEQMDFVEVMEIRDGLILRHCVYWGWYGVKLLQEDRYRR